MTNSTFISYEDFHIQAGKHSILKALPIVYVWSVNSPCLLAWVYVNCRSKIGLFMYIPQCTFELVQADNVSMQTQSIVLLLVPMNFNMFLSIWYPM